VIEALEKFDRKTPLWNKQHQLCKTLISMSTNYKNFSYI
jgi:hypothetical protein